MIYSVRGKLIHTENSAAVVECGGVGYLCQTTMNTLKTLKLNSEVTLYTYLNVREDAVDLFGFATQNELATFKTLISVSGVGPKAGLSVLSELTAEQVAMAIATDDIKTITRAQGIGKKIAQRIILELKDKLAKSEQTQEYLLCRFRRLLLSHTELRGQVQFLRFCFRGHRGVCIPLN